MPGSKIDGNAEKWDTKMSKTRVSAKANIRMNLYVQQERNAEKKDTSLAWNGVSHFTLG